VTTISRGLWFVQHLPHAASYLLRWFKMMMMMMIMMMMIFALPQAKFPP
jgi:hypothetical protein